MIKADIFNNLLDEVHKKEDEKKKLKQQKQLEIQVNMKLVEDALNDMHEKFKQALSKGTEYPKYAIIKNILCEEVKKELIINQGFLIDESFGQTKLFYNQKLFDEYVKNTKENSFTRKKDIENKAYEELTKSSVKDESANKTTSENWIDALIYLGQLQKEYCIKR